MTTQEALTAQMEKGRMTHRLLAHKHGDSSLRTTVAPDAAEEIPDGYAAVRPPVAQDPNAIPDPYAVVLEQGRQANMVKQFRSISQ